MGIVGKYLGEVIFDVPFNEEACMHRLDVLRGGDPYITGRWPLKVEEILLKRVTGGWTLTWGAVDSAGRCVGLLIGVRGGIRFLSIGKSFYHVLHPIPPEAEVYFRECCICGSKKPIYRTKNKAYCAKHRAEAMAAHKSTAAYHNKMTGLSSAERARVERQVEDGDKIRKYVRHLRHPEK